MRRLLGRGGTWQRTGVVGVVGAFPMRRMRTNREQPRQCERNMRRQRLRLRLRQQQRRQHETPRLAESDGNGSMVVCHAIMLDVVPVRTQERHGGTATTPFAGQLLQLSSSLRRRGPSSALLASLPCLAQMGWLSGDAQAAAGMSLRLPASHTENRWPVARLTANASARCSPHSYRWLPFCIVALTTALRGGHAEPLCALARLPSPEPPMARDALQKPLLGRGSWAALTVVRLHLYQKPTMTTADAHGHAGPPVYHLP
jgi:hypothetical protein